MANQTPRLQLPSIPCRELRCWGRVPGMLRALWALEIRNPPLSLPLALCGRRGQPVSGSIPLLGGQPVLNVECFDSAQLGTRQKTIRRHVLSCQLSEITRRRQVPRAAALQQSGPAVLVGLGPRGLGQPDQTLSCARRLLCGKGSQIPDCSRHRPSAGATLIVRCSRVCAVCLACAHIAVRRVCVFCVVYPTQARGCCERKASAWLSAAAFSSRASSQTVQWAANGSSPPGLGHRAGAHLSWAAGRRGGDSCRYLDKAGH